MYDYISYILHLQYTTTPKDKRELHHHEHDLQSCM